MATATKQILFSVTESNYPAWIDTAIANGWAVGTWAAISGSSPTHGLSATNVMRDVKTVNPSDSLFQGILRNWCGGAFAPDLGAFGTYIAALGGGHGGYTGNDGFGFDVDTRTWSQLWPRSSGSLNATFGEYPDGAPSCYHTYQQVFATPALPGYSAGIFGAPKSVNSTSGPTPSVSVPYPHVIDLANIGGGWTRLDVIPGSASRDSWTEAMSTVWDESRSSLWLWAFSEPQTDNTFATLNPIASPGVQWTEYRPANPNDGHGWFQNGIEMIGFIDTVRDILVLLDYRTNDTIRYLKLASPTEFNTNGATGWTIAETGSAPINGPFGEGRGIDWSTKDNCAYLWTGATTANVHKLAYSSGSVGSQGVSGNLSYAWSSVLSGSNTVIPVTQEENNTKIYNRFRIVRFGDIEIALAVTHVDGSMYAFRLS